MHCGYPVHGKETNNHGRTQFFENNRQKGTTKKTPQAHHFKNYSQSGQDSPPQALFCATKCFLTKNTEYPYK
jgi:hypothetical protein